MLATGTVRFSYRLGSRHGSSSSLAITSSGAPPDLLVIEPDAAGL